MGTEDISTGKTTTHETEAEKIQREELEREVRRNEARLEKLQAATVAQNWAEAFRRDGNFEASARESAKARRLFEEAGMPFGQDGLPRPGDPAPAAPPAPATPDPTMDLIGACVPLVLQLLERRNGSDEARRLAERRETFRSYAYVAMAAGKPWEQAAELAHGLLADEDFAAISRDEQVAESKDVSGTGLGSVGLD